MSKSSLDLEDWLYEETSKIIASSIVSRLKRITPLVQAESYKAFKDLPRKMAFWIGEEGHEDPVVPTQSGKYLPLTPSYLKRKENLWKDRRGKSLGSRQAFYSYSGKLYEDLSHGDFSFDELKKVISVKASLDGYSWFNVYQENYSALKHRLVKKIRHLKPTTSELLFKVDVDRKALISAFLKEVGKKNFEKIYYNDVWRPFLTPAIKYVLKRIVGDKIDKILMEL